MKFNSFTLSFLFISLSFLFLSTSLVAQTDKEVINKIDSYQNEVSKKFDSLQIDIKNLRILIEKSKRATTASEKANPENSKQKAKIIQLEDSIKNLNKSLVSALAKSIEMNKIVNEKDSAIKEIANLKVEVTATKAEASNKANDAALLAKNEEKDVARKNNEALAKRLLESSAIIEASAIDLLAGELDNISPLKAKLSTLKQQSQTLHNALVFLDEGKGKFADVYEALIKADFDLKIYPAQHALQQNLKKRFIDFLKSALVIKNALDSVTVPNVKMRTSKLEKLQFSTESILPFFLEQYPYLMSKWEANREKNVSLEIDAKYMVN
jgi:hypothetical protein